MNQQVLTYQNTAEIILSTKENVLNFVDTLTVCCLHSNESYNMNDELRDSSHQLVNFGKQLQKAKFTNSYADERTCQLLVQGEALIENLMGLKEASKNMPSLKRVRLMTHQSSFRQHPGSKISPNHIKGLYMSLKAVTNSFGTMPSYESIANESFHIENAKRWIHNALTETNQSILSKNKHIIIQLFALFKTAIRDIDAKIKHISIEEIALILDIIVEVLPYMMRYVVSKNIDILDELNVFLINVNRYCNLFRNKSEEYYHSDGTTASTLIKDQHMIDCIDC